MNPSNLAALFTSTADVSAAITGATSGGNAAAEALSASGLFHTLLTQQLLPAKAAVGAGASAASAGAKSTAAVGSTTPVAGQGDLLQLLAALGAGDAAGDAAAVAGAAPQDVEQADGSSHDTSADTGAGDVPPDMAALLQLLEGSAAQAVRQNPASATSSGTALGGGAGDGAGSAKVGALALTAGAGAGLLQSPGELSAAATAATIDATLQAAVDTAATNAGTAGGHSETSLVADASGATLQVTQFTAPTHDGGSAAPVAERTISIPVGQRGWSESLGSQVQWMADHKIQSARVQVTPEGLGPVEIHLSIDNADVSVNFIAQHAETRQSLEQALPQLRAMLSSAGLSLGQASVQQQAQQFTPPSQSGPTSERDADHSDETPVSMPLRTGSGLVDEYA